MAHKSGLNVLMLCDFDGRDATVMRDYLYCFNACSRHNYFYFHDCKNLTANFDFSGYDVIVLFWNCMWFWGMPLQPGTDAKIARSRALKVLFLQDEYRNVRSNNSLLDRLGIQVMMTLVAPRHHDLIYPRSGIPSLEAIYTVMTGYVPDSMVGLKLPPFETRPIDIGYRSRVMPFHLGDLAREKLTIAEQFGRIASAHGFVADISVREVDRLYGGQWLKFLKSCKFALGTESGASVVDFSGAIQNRCATYLKENPGASYEEVRGRFFADVDGRPDMKVISPRVFESAAYGNVLVQHEGDYAGMLRPDEHYISVRKDYANVAEVVERMRDTAFCKRLRDNTYRDLIASGRYSYRTFVQRFDEILETHARPSAAARAPIKLVFYFKNYIARQQELLPWGARCIRIPRPTLARSGAWLCSVISQNLLVLGLLWDVPAMRRALARYLLRPWQWREITPRALWSDLVSLGIVRAAQGGMHVEWRPYRVAATWREDEQACFLVSHSVEPEAASAAEPELPADLQAALAKGRCRRLAWNHLAVSPVISYVVGYESPGRVLQECSGLYWFCALARLWQQSAVDPAAILNGLLAGRPSALQSWRRLRLLVLCYRLPTTVCVYLVGLFRTCCGLPSAAMVEPRPVLSLLLVLGLFWDAPALRRGLIRWLLRPWRWMRTPLASLLRDLIKLGAMRCTRSHGLVGNQPFRITAAWREEDQTCCLISARCGDEWDVAGAPALGLPQDTSPKRERGSSLARASGLCTELASAIAAGRCRRIVWDHSAVDGWVSFGLYPHRYLIRPLGSNGAHTLGGFARFCEESGTNIGRVLEELLARGPCALQSWRKLRPLVLCYRRTFAVGRATALLVSLCCRAILAPFRGVSRLLMRRSNARDQQMLPFDLAEEKAQPEPTRSPDFSKRKSA
jgi:hypothetical protein